jgi:hypothetical protein
MSRLGTVKVVAMASRSWFYRALDSRLWKAIERLMLKLPYPLRFAIMFLVFIVVVLVAVLIEGLVLGYGLRLRS